MIVNAGVDFSGRNEPTFRGRLSFAFDLEQGVHEPKKNARLFPFARDLLEGQNHH